MENNIKKLEIYKDDSGCLIVGIEDNGNLEMASFDGGKSVKEFYGEGAEDCEYFVKVDKDDKDLVLLWLIKEKFKLTTDFEKWLNEKKIPNKTDMWVNS